MGAFTGFGCPSNTFGMPVETPVHVPKMAIIIDDIGFSRKRAGLFLDLDIPLTFSILPRLPLSKTLAFEIHQHHHEVMLHQPMEPTRTDADPGPGAIFTRDKKDRIQRVISENISSIPNAAGINNHMGSRYTQSRKKMDQALCAVKENGLFFVDSLTTTGSTAYDAARNMGVNSLKRNCFLDTIISEKHVFFQMLKLRAYALCHGSAIGIGHPHPETAAGISRFMNHDVYGRVLFNYASSFLRPEKNDGFPI